MVRFKNRYLLVEIIPVRDADGMKPAAPAHKKARLTDLIADKEPQPPPPSTPHKDPLVHAPLLHGLSSSNCASHIRQSMESNFGINCAAENAQSFSVKYCNAQTGTLLVRGARSSLERVWASITLLTGLPSEISRSNKDSAAYKYTWRVVHVSGTIRSAQKHAIKRSARKIHDALRSCTDESKRSALQVLAAQAEKTLKEIEA